MEGSTTMEVDVNSIQTLIEKVDNIYNRLKPQFFTKEDVCEILKISRSTLDNRMKLGKINFKKNGALVRFTKEDIENSLT